MKKKLSGLMMTRLEFCFLALLLFTLVTAALEHYAVAAGELALVVLLFAFHLRVDRRRRREVETYLDRLEGNMDQASQSGLLDCPLPVAVFRPTTDEIIWTNQRFNQLAGDRESLFDMNLRDVVPSFDSQWLLVGKTACPGEVPFNDRRYQVFGQMSRLRDGAAMAVTYWLDVTELAETRDVYSKSRPCLAILLLDNYEDAIKNLDEAASSALRGAINQKLSQWIDGTSSVFCRMDRDRYLLLFEEQHMGRFKNGKFSILDEVRSIPTPMGLPATLSIGVGTGGETLGELYRFASLSLEMALSRGGDQAVVKDKVNFQFYGGRGKETEKRTKVKSRVMASALGELVADASHLFVVGHRDPDMDAVGAAAGVRAIARKKGVPAYIIRPEGRTPADRLYPLLEKMPEYEGCFIGVQEALVKANNRSLLVVVDTNRPEQVLAPELLDCCSKVAVIDHHRRAATYIEGAAFNFHEPYASSASELVTELISYIMEPGDLLRGEAEALMAGLMLDTKNFTMRTGARTFEAASFLRRSGGDTAQVKKLFQNDLSDTVARYGIIQNARIYREDIAVAAVGHTVHRATAAQAADELLNIAGIGASFVLYPEAERVVVSARSMSDTNVQVILEALGGGGNGSAAGAQLPGKTVAEVERMLRAAIDQYFDDPGEDKSNR